MKGFLTDHKKLHIWLAVNLLLLALFYATRGLRSWMTLLATAMYALRRGLGKLSYLVPFSIMELLIVALIAFAAVYLVWTVAAVVRSPGRRGRRCYSGVLGAVCIGLTIFNGSCYLWGVNYYVDGFQEKSGIYAEDVSVEDLYAVTRYFAQQLTDTADLVERDGDGLFAVPREEILTQSTTVYDNLSTRYPFLQFDDRPPKSIFFSDLMSRMDFTGVYCPYTGESNVNVASPACLLPSTIAHELAHQRSIASEQECNFLSILACSTCGNDTYAYSGWLLGYIHLGNALYKADRTLWQTVSDTLPDAVWTDLQDNNAYWDQFAGSPVKQVSTAVYDRYLKGYGESKGIQSYGTVVDLLVVYYRDMA